MLRIKMKTRRQMNLKPRKKPQALNKSPKSNKKIKQIYKKRRISQKMTPNKNKTNSNLINKKISLRSRVTLLLASLF